MRSKSLKAASSLSKSPFKAMDVIPASSTRITYLVNNQLFFRRKKFLDSSHTLLAAVPTGPESVHERKLVSSVPEKHYHSVPFQARLVGKTSNPFLFHWYASCSFNRCVSNLGVPQGCYGCWCLPTLYLLSSAILTTRLVYSAGFSIQHMYWPKSTSCCLLQSLG